MNSDVPRTNENFKGILDPNFLKNFRFYLYQVALEVHLVRQPCSSDNFRKGSMDKLVYRSVFTHIVYSTAL
jgi:hypothetical protein